MSAGRKHKCCYVHVYKHLIVLNIAKSYDSIDGIGSAIIFIVGKQQWAARADAS